MRTKLYKEERLTFSDYGDRGFGLERLQRKKRPESVVERGISSAVEQLSLQSVDGIFRCSHRTTYLPRVAETERKIEKRSRKEILTLGHTVDRDDHESPTTNLSAWE